MQEIILYKKNYKKTISKKISKEKIYKYIKDNIKDLYTYKYILIAFVFN